MRRTVAFASCVTVILLATAALEPAAAQSNVTGQWSVLPYTMPINPIHAGLMRTGKVLVVSGTQNDPTVTTSSAAVYDPNTGVINVQTIPWDLFCNGMSWMPDGRALIAGGNLQYPINGHGWGGLKTATVFDPITEKFIQVQDMARGRWYPSVVGLPDGRMVTFSGWLEQGGTNNAVEIYTNPDGWSPEQFAPFEPELYPWLHLLPDGRLFMSGANVSSSILNPATNTWQTGVATMNYPNDRLYGSSVLLPLSAADNWRARILVLGGDNPATDTAEVIDLSQPSPRWTFTSNRMSGPRIQGNGVLLPNGKVLVLGGSAQDKTPSTATLTSDLFDPATTTFTPAATMNMPRLYHSVALLLPDGTVWVAGSNPDWGNWENRMEIYRPPYLFDASGGAATRPTITSAPSVVGYGGSFQVATPNAANIASVALIRNGANTHAFNMDQRMISLSFTRGAGTLTVTAPPDANVAPPGYYMLFIVDGNGVPSVAPFVQVSPNPSNQAPRGRIDAPAGDVTISAGQSVTFAGSATDADGAVSAYRWIIPGGTPNTSTSATPGSVTFATPGTYYVSLTVTDNQGATDPSPPTRVITVQSATLTAAFTSPADGATLGGDVNVGMSASGAGGNANTFTLTVDGTQIFSNTTSATTQTFTWRTAGSVQDGVHTLGLTVRDATGATATATRTVTINNTTPCGKLPVSFPNIAPGQTLKGTVPVQITVSGAAAGGNRFTVFVDGTQQTVIASNSSTVTWNWDTTTADNGSRTISANVQDSSGNSGCGFTYVQVQNPTLQVFITQPSSGATVSGQAVWTVIWVNGAAAGPKTYTLSIGGQTLATTTDTSVPASIPWDSTRVANGAQTLKATVSDSAGAVGSTTIPVTVQNAGPGPLTAGFSSPANGATVSGTVSVGMTASGGTAPYTYTLTINGVQATSGASNTFSWNTTAVANGSYALGLTVRDNTGATATAGITVTVQNGGGGGGGGTIRVFITQPTSGATVSGTQWVVVWIENAAAGTRTFTLTAAGQTVATTNDTSNGPITMAWVTSSTPNGPTTLTASVRDSSNNTGSGSIPVTVQNAGPGPLTAGFSSPANGATVSGTVSVGMIASGGTAPYTYTLTINSTQATSGGSNTFSWNTTAVANGSYALGLTVRDNTGATATAGITVTVQNGGGGGGGGTIGVFITQPASGATVSGTVWVTVWLDGAAAGNVSYTMTANGSTVWTESNGDRPVTLPWVTTNGSNGTQTLVVAVRDSAGATGSASVTVTVANQ